MKKNLAAIVILFASLNIWAADLTGNVTFANGRYTYSYELSASDTPVSQVLVLIDSISELYDLIPLSTTSPAGWIHNTSVGVNPNGGYGATYFGWDFLGAPGTAPVSGFSFTTYAAPAAQPVPITYMLYSPSYNGGPGNLQNFYLGSVVAPDFLTVLSVPEPESYALLLAGLGLVGALARRKSKSPSLSPDHAPA